MELKTWKAPVLYKKETELVPNEETASFPVKPQTSLAHSGHRTPLSEVTGQ